MSSAAPPPGAGEKIDLGKYLIILRRRKWWGIIPFTLLVLVFTVICLAVPPKYMSSCVIQASKSEVAQIYGAREERKRGETETTLAIVNQEMLRYDSVMNALANTNVISELERKSQGDLAVRGELREELYKRIREHTRIESMGEILIGITYLGDTPRRAYVVLRNLVRHFVENALAQERNDAGRARRMAQTELTRAEAALEGAENELVSFREDHPGVLAAGKGGRREELRITIQDLGAIDRRIMAMQSKLARYRKQLEDMPKQIVDEVKKGHSPEVTVYKERLAWLRNELAMKLKSFTRLHPAVKTLQQQIQATEEELALAQQEAAEDEVTLSTNKLRERREEEKLELEAELEYQEETRRSLGIRRGRLEEEVHELPRLQKELGRLVRERDVASDRYASARENFKRIDREFNIRMEGLVSFSVVSPVREPHEKNIKHIIKLALMGIFASFAAGVGAIAGCEFLDQSFTDVEAAREFLKLPSLGVIPYIETSGERRRRLLKYTLTTVIGVTVVAAVVLAVLFVHPVTELAEALWSQIKDLCKDLA